VPDGPDAPAVRAPSIVTLTVNPCIDQSASVDQVVAERKLRCGPPCYEPGGERLCRERAQTA
jgi:6-phosphofructokinase 2